jgi:hypothetical protein
MAAANSTTYSALLKEIWPQNDIINELYDTNQSFYGLCPKDTSFYEIVRHIAVGYGYTGGASATFSNAKANKQPTVESQFKISPVQYYSLFSIQRQLLRRAQQKKAAIVPALERQSKMAIEVWKRRMGIYLFNTNVGSIGQILTAPGGSATVQGGTTQVLTSSQIQLTASSDMRHFNKNVTVDFSVDNTGVAGVGFMVSPLIVTNLDRDNAILTFNQPIASACPSIPGTVNTYVYYSGDYNSIISGVAQWIPTTAPTSTLFFGLDRTQDIQLLSGWRISCKNKSMRAAGMTTAKVLHEIGGKPTNWFLSPNDFLNLQIELESAGALKSVKEPGAPMNGRNFGEPYEGIALMGPGGQIKCFFDINVPDNYGWMTSLDMWTYATMGDAPYFDQEDGNEILRETDADAFEGRIVGDPQLYTEAPAFSAVSLLAA